MKRSTAQREQDRADLLAALQDAALRPVRAPELVAATHGHTWSTIPDDLLHRVWNNACTDLRALARAGNLVLSTRGYVSTYTYVDLPDGALTDRRDVDDDVRDLQTQFAGWEDAGPLDD